MAASFRFTGDDPDTLDFFAGLGVNSASSCCNTLTKNDQFEKNGPFFLLHSPTPKTPKKYACITAYEQWLISQWLITITSNMLAINSCFSFTVTGDYKAL